MRSSARRVSSTAETFLVRIALRAEISVSNSSINRDSTASNPLAAMGIKHEYPLERLQAFHRQDIIVAVVHVRIGAALNLQPPLATRDRLPVRPLRRITPRD